MAREPPRLFHVPSLAPVLREGNTHSTPWLQLHTNIAALLNQGYPSPKNNINGQLEAQSVVVPLAKLTGGGANGSLTFTNGILTKAVPPT